MLPVRGAREELDGWRGSSRSSRFAGEFLVYKDIEKVDFSASDVE